MITIDEAIKKLEDILPDKDEPLTRGIYDAIQLGIEALKRVGAYRHFPDRGPGAILPGETK